MKIAIVSGYILSISTTTFTLSLLVLYDEIDLGFELRDTSANITDSYVVNNDDSKVEFSFTHNNAEYISENRIWTKKLLDLIQDDYTITIVYNTTFPSINYIKEGYNPSGNYIFLGFSVFFLIIVMLGSGKKIQEYWIRKYTDGFQNL